MGPWLPQLLARTPGIVKRQALVQLFRSTAAAFRCDMPGLRGLSYEQCLLAYARFTATCVAVTCVAGNQAEDTLCHGDDLSELQGRLYRNAYHLGRTPGWLLRVHSVEDVMALAHILYGILDIEFDGSAGGEITISRCYFSRFYSPEVCRVMSAMDRGLLAGLASGGELVFSERITEGRSCCRARFVGARSKSNETCDSCR